jgi:hypothetical protein
MCPADKNTTGSDSKHPSDCMCVQGLEGRYLETCSSCPAGKFKDTIGTEACKRCSTGSSSPVGSDSQSDCRCIAGYTGVSGACTVCEAGSYKSSDGSAPCEKCPLNSTSDEGSDAISDCLCNVGFAGRPGSTCTACSAGKYSEQLGRVTCNNCRSGSFSDEGSDSRWDCLCNSGYTQSGDSCIACERGKYKEETGFQQCDRCPEHSTTTSSGGDTKDSCICAPGFSGQSWESCVACEAGSYKVSSGDGPCSLCPEFSASPPGVASVTSCVCNMHYDGPLGGPCDLSSCPLGQQLISTTSSTCEAYTTCWPGQIVERGVDWKWGNQDGGAGMHGTVKGPTGVTGWCNVVWQNSVSVRSYRVGADSSYDLCKVPMVCRPCTAGKYGERSNLGVATCMECPFGSSTDGEGNISITSCTCQPGFTGPDGGICVACEHGKYKEFSGGSDCVSCPIDMDTLEPASDAKAACQCNPGLTVSLNGETCEACTRTPLETPPVLNVMKIQIL